MAGMELRWLVDDALNFTPPLAVLALLLVVVDAG
jgi:hypothetical protein